ncbi:hypothetical protein B0H17DRAFT_1038612, partial [Mycena rosella]
LLSFTFSLFHSFLTLQTIPLFCHILFLPPTFERERYESHFTYLPNLIVIFVAPSINQSVELLYIFLAYWKLRNSKGDRFQVPQRLGEATIHLIAHTEVLMPAANAPL